MMNTLRRWWRRNHPNALTDAEFEAYLVSLRFRIEHSAREWRCGGRCWQMQKPGAAQVWIEDGASHGDPMWSVVTRQRRHMWNGHRTAWCLECCRLFTPMTPEEMAQTDATPHDPIPTIPLMMRGGRSGKADG
jgi:hypothetical protein